MYGTVASSGWWGRPWGPTPPLPAGGTALAELPKMVIATASIEIGTTTRCRRTIRGYPATR
jgi:hypothetical protein